MNMILRSRNPMAPRRVDLFSELSKEFDRVSNEVFGAPFFKGVNKHKGYPLVDAIRDEETLTLQYTVPGVKKDDLNVEIIDDEDGSLLIVNGKLSSDYVHNDEYYQIKELSKQEFRRIVRLPDDIDSEVKPVTTLSDGILMVDFALKKIVDEPKNKVRKLEIS